MIKRKKIDDKAKTHVHPPVTTQHKKTTHGKFQEHINHTLILFLFLKMQ